MDWTGIDLYEIVETVKGGLDVEPPGSSAIILHHDIAYTTPGAQGILDFYAAYLAGYDFVSMPQCLSQCQADGACKAPVDVFPGIYDS